MLSCVFGAYWNMQMIVNKVLSFIYNKWRLLICHALSFNPFINDTSMSLQYSNTRAHRHKKLWILNVTVQSVYRAPIHSKLNCAV